MPMVNDGVVTPLTDVTCLCGRAEGDGSNRKCAADLDIHQPDYSNLLEDMFFLSDKLTRTTGTRAESRWSMRDLWRKKEFVWCGPNLDHQNVKCHSKAFSPPYKWI